MRYILQSFAILTFNNTVRLFSDNKCIELSLKMFKSIYLNVAEKNDAAKNIAKYLSRGTATRTEGFSTYNKIYTFETEFMRQKCKMVMTSVSGHLMEFKFPPEYEWKTKCDPITLFDAQVNKHCPEDRKNIRKTLEREVKNCNGLIIWTDCDREGENIGYEIIQVCTEVKPNLQIYRAIFSDITSASVTRALNNLGRPNQNISDAVDVRQELDLRIGASFTRYQTVRLQRKFGMDRQVVSYGSCQIPTLGFVVERFKARDEFIKEPFWKIKVRHTLNNLNVDFLWERVRLFDKDICRTFYAMCSENRQATVTNVHTKPKSKWRPLPLDTIQLEKLSSTKLKINAKETMKIAEKLYMSGFISYPRTETNEFSKDIKLEELVKLQVDDQRWGSFARNIVQAGPNPRKGSKNDGAHPPIHPTKCDQNLSGNEQRVYELIARSFLACCSKDAQGLETTVNIEIANERFNASGLNITERNYLEVYPYDKWSSKEIHAYENGQIFNPTSIDMEEGETSPPNLLTEADLIALMEKHCIGTDATHAEHIETIKKRHYAAVVEGRFVPTELGMGLVSGYQDMGLGLHTPALRARLEADLRRVCDGQLRPRRVLQDQINIHKNIFIQLTQEAEKLDNAISKTLNIPVSNNNSPEFTPVLVTKCPLCGSHMRLRRKRNNENEFYIGCDSYPACKKVFWLKPVVKSVEVLSDTCSTCGPNNKKLKFEWSDRSLSSMFPPPYIGCIGGCDRTLNDVVGVYLGSVRNPTIPPSNNPIIPPTNSTTRPNPPNNQLRSNNQTNQQIVRSRPFVPPLPDSPAREDLSDNTVLCRCSLPASEYTSNQQNENAGRKFYKCQTCQFFQWGPPVEPPQHPYDTPSPSDASSGRTAPDCHCGWVTIQKEKMSEGPNKGCKYFVCSKKTRACKFFQWAEPETNTGGNVSNNLGRAGSSRTFARGSGGGNTVRKCSVCHTAGHFKNNCPNKF